MNKEQVKTAIVIIGAIAGVYYVFSKLMDLALPNATQQQAQPIDIHVSLPSDLQAMPPNTTQGTATAATPITDLEESNSSQPETGLNTSNGLPPNVQNLV